MLISLSNNKRREVKEEIEKKEAVAAEEEAAEAVPEVAEASVEEAVEVVDPPETAKKVVKLNNHQEMPKNDRFERYSNNEVNLLIDNNSSHIHILLANILDLII
jgi:hypothetical protein